MLQSHQELRALTESRQARFYQEQQSKDDTRSPFQRDRDRVLYSTALRRLANITQVVSADNGYSVHNRLTHSIKVAQVARRFAERFISQHDLTLINKIGLDPDVVETAALAHDLGHPPFGHVGEEVLNTCLQKKLNIDGYEGNAQSFRIVTRLELSRNHYHGLNLTRASLNAVLKYPWIRSAGTQTETKWGAYIEDRDMFEWVRAPLSQNEAYPQRTFEAEIMNLADDITYSVHDMDDFYRAGILPLNELLSNPDEREKFLDHCCVKLDLQSQGLTSDDVYWAFIDLFGTYPKELETPFHGYLNEVGNQVQFVSRLIGKFSRTFSLEIKGGLTSLNSDVCTRLSINILKQMMHYYVYDHPSLAAQQHGERRLLKELFDIIYDATGSQKDINILAPRHKSLVEHELNIRSLQTM